jgi:hypothetical protein
MKIDIKADLKKLNKNLVGFQKDQIPFASMLAINDTTKDMRIQLHKDMETIFSKGVTRFTKQGLFRKFATKRIPEGAIYFKPAQAKYLEKQVFGGVRTEKSPIPIPYRNRVKLSAQGNLSKAKLKSLINKKKNRVLKINGVGGVYEINKGEPPKLLVALDSNVAVYKNPKFNFFSLGRRVFDKKFVPNYKRRLKFSLRTARR